MAAIGQPFADSVPAVGTAGTAYASTVNAILQECIDRLSTSIPTGSIAAATASLDMNNQGVINAQYLGLYDQSDTPAGAPYGRFEAFGSDVYWVGTAGVIRMTRDGEINVTGVAGIGGDYGSGDPSLLRFVGGSETYEFYDDYGAATPTWAVIKARELNLIDEGTAFSVVVKPSATTAANWTLTLPVNDPAAGVALLSLSNTGVMATGTTISAAEAFSGVVTFSADPVLSGTTNIRHGTRTVTVGINPITNALVTVTAGRATADAAAQEIVVPLDLEVGQRILSVTARGVKSTGGTATLILKKKVTAGAITPLGTNTDATFGAYAFSTTALTETVVGSYNYWISLTLPASTDYVDTLEYAYDVVA